MYLFCNAHIKREEIIDKQLNKSVSISFSRNNTLTKNKTNQVFF